MKNWGIRTRVLLLALLPAVAIAVLLAGYMAWRIAADSERDLRNYGHGLARQLAAVSEFSTYSGDRETLRKIAIAALDESYVTAAAVFDDQGMPIAASGALPSPLKTLPLSRAPFLLDNDDERLLFIAPVVLHRYDVSDPFLSESTAPVWPAQAATIGWVTLELTRAAAQKRKQEAIFFTLLSSLAVVLIGGIMAFILGRQVTRPILRLENTVARIQAGDLGARVPPDSGGDLQRLEEGMNAMAQALHDNRELLEARVRAATSALEDKKNEAERASVAKSRFLAAASHDLRQPLHALSLFAADLRHEAVTPPQRRLAGQINDSVRGISELLDALLDVSRLDVAGVTPLAIGQPLAETFRHLEAGFARSAAAKSLRLRCRPTRLQVTTDPALLERLLGNLLTNAIRYTESGSVLVAARRRGDRVRIEVRDSGIGIAAEHRHAIFEEFYQIGNTARELGQGLGLGLAIVSRLARILGTRIEVRSAPGRGSVFALDLPLATADSVREETQRNAPAPHREPQLLLLGARNPELESAEQLAATWGYASAWAEDAKAGAADAPRAQAFVALGFADEIAPATIESLRARGAGIILLGTGTEEAPAGAHGLRLPLRPAKLRALLAQLLTESARA
ncbi:MAG: hypothetical protein BGO63_07895 [Candidatus Accumulibacter sp. 66-26]|nr:HAMP domain-containing protein [Accumulibacter sp.]OJW49212.1 MAG: hypothetical protein BGO63_07895 [Candidatus Accumulibacter sp. 66-26]